MSLHPAEGLKDPILVLTREGVRPGEIDWMDRGNPEWRLAVDESSAQLFVG
jgi:hypothetical protein